MAIEIYNINDLQAMNLDRTQDYILMNDIDASDTINWNSGQGFVPIGGTNWAQQFRGTLDGNNFKIINLYINRPTTNFQGLFGQIRSGVNFFVRNLGLVNCNISGGMRTGAIVGNQLDSNGIVENCFSTGQITSSAWAGGGGIVGYNSGIIRNCYSRCNINVGADASNGGICASNAGTIDKCYFAGTFSGTANKHGISPDGTVTNSFFDQLVAFTSLGTGTPKNTIDMINVATYTQIATVGLTNTWDFKNNPFDDVANLDIWNISPVFNNGYPFLSWEGDPVSGNTLSASNITYESARFNGELYSDGDNTITVSFRYRRVGLSWNPEIIAGTLTSPSIFFYDMFGLIPDSGYEFQAIFRWDTNEIFGDILTFSTLPEPDEPETETLSANSIGSNSATLNGRLTKLGVITNVNLYFEYKRQTDVSWTRILSASNITIYPYNFSLMLNLLDENIFYEYRTVATWSGGEYIGNIINFYTAGNASLYFLKNGVEIPTNNFSVYGEIETDGSWRLSNQENFLITEKRINGEWVRQYDDNYKIHEVKGSKLSLTHSNIMLPFLISNHHGFQNFLKVYKNGELQTYNVNWTETDKVAYRTNRVTDRIKILGVDSTATYKVVYYEPKSNFNFNFRLRSSLGRHFVTSMPARMYYNNNIYSMLKIKDVEFFNSNYNMYKVIYTNVGGNDTNEYKHYADYIICDAFEDGQPFGNGWVMEILMGNNRLGKSSKGINYRPFYTTNINKYNFPLERNNIKRRLDKKVKGDLIFRMRNTLTNETTDFYEKKLKLRAVAIKDINNNLNMFKGYVYVPQLISL